jgi:hypothetical protein
MTDEITGENLRAKTIAPMQQEKFDHIIERKKSLLSQALISDLGEICRQNEDTEKIHLITLRRELTKQLLTESGFLKSEDVNDEVVEELISQNPKTRDEISLAERYFLTTMAIKLKEQNDQLRSEQSQELKKKEGLEFNLRIDNIPAAHTMIKAQAKPDECRKIFSESTTETLLKINYAYYLDLWSRYWQEDSDYAAYFKGEDAYLVGSYLPIDQGQLVIPAVYLSPLSAQELQRTKKTQTFALDHYPYQYLPLSAKISGNSLAFEINKEAIGSFPGMRMVAQP